MFRWVSLEGNNIGKVEAGTMLIVKADDTGPLNSLVKCKVLAVENKSAQDALTATEGWIEGNDDPAGNPVVERSGVYMKIKPSGFKMDWNPNNFISYNDTDFLNSFPPESGVIKNILPKRLFYRGLLIVAVPIVILQITISLVFFDSLWIKTNKGLTKV